MSFIIGLYFFAIVLVAEGFAIQRHSICDICNTKEQFIVQEKVLNVCGTYDTAQKRLMSFKFLKIDFKKQENVQEKDTDNNI